MKTQFIIWKIRIYKTENQLFLAERIGLGFCTYDSK